MYYRTVDAADRQVAVGCKSPDRLLLGRWVNPTVETLSALVLGSYLLISHPVPSTAPAPPSVVEAPLVFASTQLSLGSYTASTSNLTVATNDAKPMSTIDLLEAVFGSVLALAWAMIGAWLGARREPAQTPINRLARDRTATTALMAGSAYAALRGLTYEGMRRHNKVASKAVGDGAATRIG
jgi:hypothetical protein